jgi:hypothetical protein
MKTFIVLFVIAVSLPADAQRVRENIRQRTVIKEGPQLVEASVSGTVKTNDTRRKR